MKILHNGKSIWTKVALAGVLCVSLGYAADYSEASNEDLIKLNNGKLNAADAADLKLEVIKRLGKIDNADEKKEFMGKLKEAYEKATNSWKVQKLRSYEKEVHKAFHEKIEALSNEEKAALKLDEKCPYGGADKEASKKK